MKKLIIILILLIAYGCNWIYGQVTITTQDGAKLTINDPEALNQAKDPEHIVFDTAYLRASYRQLLIQDTVNNTNPKSSVMLLQIGKRLTKYWGLDSYIIDSLTAAYREAGENTVSIIQKTIGLDRGDFRDEVIFSNMKPDYLTVTVSMALARLNSEYEEIIPKIDWHLEKDTMTVMNYLCKKATCRLFGRNYTAWYTPLLPVQKGPWKFSGLPGLILKVSDDREQVFFDCIGIERVSWIDPIYLTEREYVKSDKKTVLETYNSYKSDPMPYVEGTGTTVTPLNGQPEKPRKKFYHNPIELSE
ncbi:MAG: GLPGLI family protein [Tannerella sp.]|jgi:GLPGLI family protein|nr:GLPGLI family protein [Tannerella sp.]